MTSKSRPITLLAASIALLVVYGICARTPLREATTAVDLCSSLDSAPNEPAPAQRNVNSLPSPRARALPSERRRPRHEVLPDLREVPSVRLEMDLRQRVTPGVRV